MGILSWLMYGGPIHYRSHAKAAGQELWDLGIEASDIWTERRKAAVYQERCRRGLYGIWVSGELYLLGSGGVGIEAK